MGIYFEKLFIQTFKFLDRGISMSSKSLKIYFIVFVIFAIPVLLFAEQKIAVINMEQVFSSYYKTKLEDAKLKKQTDVFKEYLTSLNASKEKLNVEFVELRDSSQNIAFSDVERENKRIAAQNKYRQMQAKDAEIQQYNQEKKDQLMKEWEATRQKLLSDITAVVKSKAVRENYTIVIDNSGQTLNNIPAVVYNNSSIEITDSVIKELNLGNEKK